MHQQRGVAAIVQNHVGAFFGCALGTCELENPVRVVPIVGQRLALDSKNGRTRCSQRSSGMVLCRENVARCPAHFGTQGLKRLNQHGGLNRHVDGARDACTGQRLVLGELMANRHQARHFGFSHFNFFAAPGSQRNVGNHIVRKRRDCGESRFKDGVHMVFQNQTLMGKMATSQSVRHKKLVFNLTRLQSIGG